jgi:hypothetical protein
MKARHLAIAAAVGLLLATSPASATPLAPTSAAPIGLERLDSAVETVTHRHRAVRRHVYRPYRAPAITFGLGPIYTPYYAYPYRHTYYPVRPYRYTYPYPYAYPYGVAPAFSFGFHIR